MDNPSNTTSSTPNPSVHPIEGLMKTAMESIKGMIDVNTVVGQPVETRDGGTIIPVSRVSFGFAAGGGEYWSRPTDNDGHPFGGGSGAGVTVHPVGFLVMHGDNVRLLSVDKGDIWESLANNVPQLIDQLQSMWKDRENPASKRQRSTIINPDTVS
ncbi:GerW family sporulation protein [Sulfobacillus harzensis]|uniref:Sporulation protein YtfJ n=1 Tax=Sulfobacillus harzensis TaxID=2729629 RepID=A0A7Y0L351_9FIRM|nr:GerW family sporulation protein [Sulfobacillus harzensis]NMP22437.1 sporulation protein YtfJ [Sulfobacillus harzensis]